MRKKILIISVGPVPTTNKINVEGGGLRAWGIAKGLLKNGIDVAIAIPEEYNSGTDKSDDGIKVFKWNFSNLTELMKKHDAVYVLYSHPTLMEYVANNIENEKQLIVDLYVPIYLESLARDLKGTFEEFNSYQDTVRKWNLAFPRGDYFLAANNSQYHFYNGCLSVFGRNNSFTFNKNILEILPYGIHSQPIKHTKKVCREKIIHENDFMLLWFGGLYPWFDIKPLLLAMQNLSSQYKELKLIILGGKNPFVTEPGFMKQYDFALDFAKKNGLFGKSIHFVNWIPYEERNNWYLESDLVINLHHKSKESIYSWRTRIIDYIWGELPIISTGGDEATEYLAQKNCAVILEENSQVEIEKKITDLIQNRMKLEALRKNIRQIKPEFYWENLTKNLAEFIKSGEIAADRKILLNQKPITKQKREKSFFERVGIGIKIIQQKGFRAFIQEVNNYFNPLEE